MKRIRIGLRLMLLIVALFAVFFAWIGARRELQRIELRGQIQRLQIDCEYAEGRVTDPAEGEFYRNSLADMKAVIVSKQNQLGEESR
ncbi:MAG: hypothetical protein L0228_00425 [Planctomycetes bacterium]|nr:hypothetical protein [Planctomycetota bacterium]